MEFYKFFCTDELTWLPNRKRVLGWGGITLRLPDDKEPTTGDTAFNAYALLMRDQMQKAHSESVVLDIIAFLETVDAKNRIGFAINCGNTANVKQAAIQDSVTYFLGVEGSGCHLVGFMPLRRAMADPTKEMLNWLWIWSTNPPYVEERIDEILLLIMVASSDGVAIMQNDSTVIRV